MAWAYSHSNTGRPASSSGVSNLSSVKKWSVKTAAGEGLRVSWRPRIAICSAVAYIRETTSLIAGLWSPS